MTRHALSKVSIPLAMVLLATAAIADRSDKEEKNGSAPLQLPITGSVAPKGQFEAMPFAGTFSVERFEARGDQVMAVGFVRGAVAGARTGLAGEVALPVQVGPGSQGVAAPASSAAQQQATTCQALHLEIGAATLNVLGLTVATQPIAIDLSGNSSAPLGNLVCTILQTLNNVVGLVGLLNQLLGTLTGLVGGLVP
jgi:hypothetical protein